MTGPGGGGEAGEAAERRARREAALAHVTTLIGQLRAWDTPARAELVQLGDHLHRAVTAFHLEAIRFRMYSLDRALKQHPAPPEIVATFEAVRADLEAAGFSTRSHA